MQLTIQVVSLEAHPNDFIICILPFYIQIGNKPYDPVLSCMFKSGFKEDCS